MATGRIDLNSRRISGLRSDVVRDQKAAAAEEAVLKILSQTPSEKPVRVLDHIDPYAVDGVVRHRLANAMTLVPRNDEPFDGLLRGMGARKDALTPEAEAVLANALGPETVQFFQRNRTRPAFAAYLVPAADGESTYLIVASHKNPTGRTPAQTHFLVFDPKSGDRLTAGEYGSAWTSDALSNDVKGKGSVTFDRNYTFDPSWKAPSILDRIGKLPYMARSMAYATLFGIEI
ncbi:MAG: hypothetical protein ACT4TC_22275 [Myxococcaceae bacterium]